MCISYFTSGHDNNNNNGSRNDKQYWISKSRNIHITKSEAWVLAISLADKRRNHHSNLDDAAGYLRHLKRLLEDEDDTGELPTTYPPKPRWDSRHRDTISSHTSNINDESATAALINDMPQLTISTNNGTSNINHFAVFNDDEEDEDDDVGGDTIVYQTQQQQNERARTNNNNHQSSKNMSTHVYFYGFTVHLLRYIQPRQSIAVDLVQRSG